MDLFDFDNGAGNGRPYDSRAAADAGRELAAENAERQHDGWNQRAFDLFVAFARRGLDFRTEQARAWAHEECGLIEPPTSRAWGSVAVRAVKAGIVEKVGVALTTLPPAHATYVAVWRVK